MLQVGDKKIIDHQISWLRQCNVTDILVVTGYLNHMIESHLIDSYLNEDVRFMHYPNYENTNNLATLYSVRDELNDDVVILFSDVLLSVKLLYRCINSSDNICLIVDTENITDKTMRVIINDDLITDIGGHIPFAVRRALIGFLLPRLLLTLRCLCCCWPKTTRPTLNTW